MANRWGNSGNSVRLYFGGGSKITADGDCSHEIKRHLLLGRKVNTNLHSILKELCTVTVEFHPGRQGLFSIGKLTSAIYYIRKVKEKRSHMVISIDGGKKHLTKFNSLFMMKILNKIEIERLP